MANITLIRTCNSGVWGVELTSNDTVGFESAMTSNPSITPVQWFTSHFYSVPNNQTKEFWLRKDGVVTHVSATFGYCAGIPTTTTQNTAGSLSTAPTIFTCVSTFNILPLFLEVRKELQQIPNPIYSIKSTCKCDILSVEITQVPTKGTLISTLFDGNTLQSGDFEHMGYLVNNVLNSGTDVIKYILHTSCGDSPEGRIELKLI